MTISMTQNQYDTLLAVAFGTETLDHAALLALRKDIDTANGITRYFLYILWQDLGQSPIRKIEIGLPWPAGQKFALEMFRPITLDDVTAVLADNAIEPVSVLLTRDREGIVGLIPLESYNFSLP